MEKPTPEQLRLAVHQTLPDIIAPGLRILFCGINPGLYSAAVGHHFARPGNRFWPALYAAGLTPRLLTPDEDEDLLRWGYGLTNIVTRASAAAGELTREELRSGRLLLEEKLHRYRPATLAILGLGAYRTAFAQPRAPMGKQLLTIADTAIWVLPNPSGLNARFQLADFAACFQSLLATD